MTDAVLLPGGRNIATESEKALLEQQRTYRVKLNRVETSAAPDVSWPEKPEQKKTCYSGDYQEKF
ncbi:tail fiber assembly protein [Pantoea allii]|uniref:tail fiber assembly protein n=1 Tax=Pantoea allii TaxID=574096 RepID=UPI0024B8359C|nr:tail fiber assembly protein [Pantoea allii]MDJ0088236.1 tail fiber assembly protein [Pantoea allii]